VKKFLKTFLPPWPAPPPPYVTEGWNEERSRRRSKRGGGGGGGRVEVRKRVGGGGKGRLNGEAMQTNVDDMQDEYKQNVFLQKEKVGGKLSSCFTLPHPRLLIPTP